MDVKEFLKSNMKTQIMSQGITELNAMKGVDYAMLSWGRLGSTKNAFRDMVNLAGGRAASLQGKKWKLSK